MKRFWSMVVVAACAAPQQEYAYQAPNAPARKLAPVTAEVVPAPQAEASGLPGDILAVPFEGPADGTQLVADYLARADAARVRYIADLAIYLQTTKDGVAIECRADIVPELYTESVHRPARYELVSEMKPVQRTVTEYEYRCQSVTRYESKLVTEYQQKCGSTTRPVQRSRTVYRSEYNYATKSTRSVPHTEYYTDYQHHYECKQEPVTRYKSEPVTKQDCKSEPVTRTVTRYEHQLENRYVPARLDLLTRQRLRELEPSCYRLDLDEPDQQLQNRIEGRIFVAK